MEDDQRRRWAEEIQAMLLESVEEIFSTMIPLPLEPADDVDIGKTADRFTSMIGLAGSLKGLMYLHFPVEVAVGLTGAMLGMEVTEADEDVSDCLGEIANMVAGGFKSRLEGRGVDTSLAIPTTVRGRQVQTSGKLSTDVSRLAFSTQGGGFSLELQYLLAI